MKSLMAIFVLMTATAGAHAQTTISDIKIEAKDRVLSKTTEAVTKCHIVFVGGGDSRSCINDYHFTVVSRIQSQKWLESNGQIVPNSLVLVEEVKSEVIRKTADTGSLACDHETTKAYCENVLQAPYIALIGRIK